MAWLKSNMLWCTRGILRKIPVYASSPVDLKPEESFQDRAQEGWRNAIAQRELCSLSWSLTMKGSDCSASLRRLVAAFLYASDSSLIMQLLFKCVALRWRKYHLSYCATSQIRPCLHTNSEAMTSNRILIEPGTEQFVHYVGKVYNFKIVLAFYLWSVKYYLTFFNSYSILIITSVSGIEPVVLHRRRFQQ